MAAAAKLPDPATAVSSSSSYGSTGGSISSRVESRIFPMRPIFYLEDNFPSLKALIPSHYRIIQGWPHFMLALGVAANTILLLIAGHEVNLHLREIGVPGHGFFIMWQRLLPMAFSLLCLIYFTATIQHYNANLQDKQKELRKGKEETDRLYKSMLAELETSVSSSMETQSMLAESNLEAKRRDCSRFFQNIKPALSESSASKAVLLENFRNFVLLWLKVFKECSTSPVDEPFIVVAEEELTEKNCGSALEVAELVGKNLKTHPIKLVSDHVEKDKEKISLWRKGMRTASGIQKGMMQMARLKSIEEDAEDGTSKLTSEFSSFTEDELRWLRFGCTGFGVTVSDDGDNFPISIAFGFGRLTLLSSEHNMLLLSFFFGVAIMIIEVLNFDNYRGILEANLGVCLTCQLFILYDFISIDAVQRWEAEIKECTRAKDELEEKRNKVLDFYGKALLLSDLWLHCTLPRLTMMKNFGEMLEEAEPSHFLGTLKDTTAKFKALEESLPALDVWQIKGGMNDEIKSRIGNVLSTASRAKTPEEALRSLPEVTALLTVETSKIQSSDGVKGGKAIP
eukprot:TRINITY_DN48780_c0_g1_i1.p1 TRINITY_DN48780_c0_g1~~TRINITY_DN48780_c0_g1_i1.p1  ORF type:complete len:568 (-),score=109.34 TRINITY_DN48780_c0_g1_i1:78-1781(-)